MLKHILIPLDGSERAESAIPHALQIASPDTKITLLYVVEIPLTPYPISPSVPVLPQEVEDYIVYKSHKIAQAEDYLNKVRSSFQENTRTIEIRVMVGSDPASHVIDFSTEQAVNVIVMATRGRSGITRWLLGSVTQKVLQAASCPVLVVPSELKAR